jgi:hypothetical protein
MVLVSAFIAWCVTGELPLADVGLGWALAVANGIAAALIYQRALNQGGNAFLLWALGVNGIRVLCALALVIALFVFVVTHQVAFLVAVLTGTACYLVSEVRILHLALAN